MQPAHACVDPIERMEGVEMSVRKRIFGLSVGMAMLASCRAAQAVIVFATDFNQVATGSGYADQTTLSNAAGTTDDVGLRTGGANSNFALVDRGSGNRALQLIDNDSTQGTFPKANSANFSGTMSTTNTGNNTLTGSFTYTRLLTQTSTTTSPSFAFTATASTGGFVLEVTVENDGHVHYYNGATNTDSGVTLQTGTEYTFQMNADLSSSSQDKWSLQVIPVGSQTPALNVANLNTIVANAAIIQFSFWGGLNQPAVNSTAFGQVDNISFSAQPIPEPAFAGVFIGTLTGLLVRRKR
jgi:hypothetical protein